jgi:hypothetical protein
LKSTDTIGREKIKKEQTENILRKKKSRKEVAVV